MNSSVYLAESAAARALWLIQYDIIKHPRRNIGEANTPEQITIDPDDHKRFQADGREYIINVNGVDMSVTISDMISGITLNDINSISNLNILIASVDTDPDAFMAVSELKERLMDYIDADDYVRINGMERGEYARRNLPMLPRNDKLNYREELLWIPGFRDFFKPDANGILSSINIIPPPGLSMPRGKPSIMSASPELIRQLCKLDDTQMQRVQEILKQFRQDKQISFNDAFAQAPELQNTLKQHFSFSESGYYTLSIRPASNSGVPGRLLSISIAIRAFIPPTGLRYHNWQLH
jgi:hypothetical protein